MAEELKTEQQPGGDDELKSLLRDAIKDAATGREPTSQKLKLRIGDEDREFGSLAELQEGLNGTLSAYQRALAEVTGANNKILETKQSTLAPKTNEFSKETFMELLEKDPVKGMKYINSFALFDGATEDPGALLRATAARASNLEQQLVAYQFRSRHQEVDQLLNDEKRAIPTMQVLGNVMQELGYQGISLPALEASYAVAAQRGLLPGPRPKEGRSEGGAPPMLGRSSGGTGDATFEAYDDFAALPYEKRAAVLRQMGGRE